MATALVIVRLDQILGAVQDLAAAILDQVALLSKPAAPDPADPPDPWLVNAKTLAQMMGAGRGGPSEWTIRDLTGAGWLPCVEFPGKDLTYYDVRPGGAVDQAIKRWTHVKSDPTGIKTRDPRRKSLRGDPATDSKAIGDSRGTVAPKTAKSFRKKTVSKRRADGRSGGRPCRTAVPGPGTAPPGPDEAGGGHAA